MGYFVCAHEATKAEPFLVLFLRHHPYRLGLHSLQWRRVRADLIKAFKIFKGLLDIDSNLLFRPPARRGLRGHPRCEPQPKGRVGIFGEGCEILEQAPRFSRYSSFCQCFQEKVGERVDGGLSPSPSLTEHSSPHFPTPPPPSHLHTTH